MDGAPVSIGCDVAVHYTGWFEDGNKFDSSLDRGTPFTVEGVGSAPVIQGWNEGVQGMKVGGKRLLVVPGPLGYGANGIPGAIPPNATLVFQVDVLEVS